MGKLVHSIKHPQGHGKVVSILRTNIDEGLRYRKYGQCCKTKSSFTTHSFKSGYIVLCFELLLIHHLGGRDDLGAEYQEVSVKTFVVSFLHPGSAMAR